MKKKRLENNSSRGLGYKLRVAVALMAIIPILVCLYLLSRYVSLQKGVGPDILASLLIVVFISGMGFFLIKEVFSRIAAITLDAKLIAAGDYSRNVKIKDGDEVSDLAKSLNQLTRNIRSDMDELKKYGEKTAEINIEVQKRIVVVSSLLQISSLISEGAKISDILKLSVEKSRLIGDSDVAYLVLQEENGLGDIYVKVVDGINMQSLLNTKMRIEDSVFSKVIRTNKCLAIDSDNRPEERQFLDFQDKFKSKNTLMQPVYLKGRVAGVLGVANAKDVFIYRKDDIDLLDLFAKQVAIALENEILSTKIEKLEITDGLTGLYNNAFIHNRLNEEIKRAIVYQRPCSFVLLNIDNFQKLRSEFSSLETESVLKKIAYLIRDSVTEIDRVARFADNEFAIVLPEKNKRQAHKMIEEVRKKVESSFLNEPDSRKRITISGGLSENPLDGVTADQLINKARDLLSSAKAQGKNCILV